jgi:endonuclease/exonuclease/phosphatase family metal-dependent hydrolase
MGRIHVVNTHLSVYKLEAWMQAKALLAGDWFAGIGVDQPVILCGDLNAGPFSGVYRTLARQFTDVQTLSGVGLTPEPTFHARSTHWRIDHIFVSGPIRPIAVEVPRDAKIRMSSDHLPLVANLTIDGGSDGDVPNSAISSKAAE